MLKTEHKDQFIKNTSQNLKMHIACITLGLVLLQSLVFTDSTFKGKEDKTLKDAVYRDRSISYKKRLAMLKEITDITNHQQILSMQCNTKSLGRDLTEKDFSNILGNDLDVSSIYNFYTYILDKKLYAHHNITQGEPAIWQKSRYDYHYTGFYLQPSVYDPDLIYFAYLDVTSRDFIQIDFYVRGIQNRIINALSYSTSETQDAFIGGYSSLMSVLKHVTSAFVGFLFG